MINKRLTCLALTANEVQLSAIYSSFFDKDNKLSVTNRIHQMQGFNSETHSMMARQVYVDSYYHNLRRFLGESVSE
jgi:hypothetical protein